MTVKHNPEVFNSKQRWLMIEILCDLKAGKNPAARVTKQWELLVLQETCGALRDAGYIDSKGALTSAGLFIAFYPHLAPGPNQ
jgi:hypothetical protein